MQAELITIGTELLLGQLIDTNSSWLAKKMAGLGIDVYYKTTVGDNKKRLKKVLQKAQSRSDLVITTGGLGPTQDDITRESVAEAFDLELDKLESVLQQVKCYFNHKDQEMSINNIRQTYFPKGAEIIENDRGTAPGFLLEKGGKLVVSLPGVPREMKQMMKGEVIPYLEENFPLEETIYSRVIKTCGIGESDLEMKVEDILEAQTNPTIALLADLGEVKLRLTAKAKNKKEAKKLIAAEEKRLKERIGDCIYGYDDDTLEEVVAKNLCDQDLTLAVAESCTGGLLGHRLTNVAGSSSYFDRGLVTYSNRAKKELLGVKEKTLKDFGAVSRQTAREMAAGVKEFSDTDLGLAITGIAGPGGGTEEKPVGLVYMAAAFKNQIKDYKLNFNGTRERIKYLTTQIVLNNLLQLLN